MRQKLQSNIIDKIFSLLDKLYPNARTELNYLNDYHLLIAIILSAQATDKKVNQVTEKIFPQISTPEDMLNLGIIELKKIIFPLGLSNIKANNILKLSEILVQNYSSKIPTNFEELILLPGVGRKTANVLLNNLFEMKKIAVDTHVKRFSNRIGFVNFTNLLKIEQKLVEIIPDKWLNKAHNLMVLHGRYICIARKPKCNECVVAKYCLYYNQILHEHSSI